MRVLNKTDINSISGGYVGYIDLFAIWAGYNDLNFKNTLTVGTLFGAAIGVMIPVPPGTNKLTWVVTTAGVSAAYTAFNYYVGQYASSMIRESIEA